ncbi:MAG: alpha/beta hydrolase [Bryobacteraceae bacterium]
MSEGLRITRRAVLLGGLGVPLLAQQKVGPPPHEHGPKVFLDYDQVELDAAYDQAAYATNNAQVGERGQRNSDLVRGRLGAPLRVTYGSSAIEKIDIYKTAKANAPVHIFIHGGAWRGGSARGVGYIAEPFVIAGAHVAIPDFAPVLDVGGSLLAMAAQVRSAIGWVGKNAGSFGGDPKRIYLSGHSSGAHLAGCALVVDWAKEFGLSPDLLKGALLVSGMYDLKGPRISSRHEYVRFDDETEESLSIQRHLDPIHTPVTVAYASFDTPEFQRQSRDFASAMRAVGKPVELLVGQGYNHFEFIETLGNPYGILGRAAMGMMKL